MKFYFAARVSRVKEMRAYRARVIDLGRECVSRWIDEELLPDQNDCEGERGMDTALRDQLDVLECDCLVIFEEPQRCATRNARMVELGLAIAWGKKVVAIASPTGQNENVFFALPTVKVFPDWSSFDTTIRGVLNV